MKKLLMVFVLLVILSTALFAEEIEKEEKNIWEIIGTIALFTVGIIVLIIIAIIFFFALYGGRSDSGSIKMKVNEALTLKLRELLDTEEDEISLKFLIKKIVGDKITLQCEICKGGKLLLTKTIGANRTKKVTEKIKEMLVWPIDISVSCEEYEMEIEVQRIIPENPNYEFGFFETNF